MRAAAERKLLICVDAGDVTRWEIASKVTYVGWEVTGAVGMHDRWVGASSRKHLRTAVERGIGLMGLGHMSILL